MTADENLDGGRALLPDSRRTGIEWLYTTERPGRGWSQPGFDDSAWTKGWGGFGQVGTPGSAVRTTWDTRNIWLRKSFQATEIPAGLALNLHHDDDVEVYLNGKPIYRARGYLVAYRRIVLGEEAVSALRKGTNLLAVHCRQVGPQTDRLAATDDCFLVSFLLRQGLSQVTVKLSDIGSQTQGLPATGLGFRETP